MPCSFCRSSSHTIRSCNSERINLVYQDICFSLSLIRRIHTNSEVTIFKHICEIRLQRVKLINLKVVCVRLFGLSSSKSKQFYIRHLIEDCLDIILYGDYFDIYSSSETVSETPNNDEQIMNMIVHPANDTEKDNHDCAICLESNNYSNLVELNCSHKFCSSCIASSFTSHDNNRRPTCALCRSQIYSITVENTTSNNVLINQTYNYIKIVS